MNNIYLNKINELIDLMIDEYGSKHETTTKVLNYQYYCGQLHAIYELIQENEGLEKFTPYYEHRKTDRDRITEFYNKDFITPLYNIARKTMYKRGPQL